MNDQAPRYCIDTSALVAAWSELYPPENFPRLWERFEDLAQSGRLLVPDQVLDETSKRSDELHRWVKSQAGAIVDIDEPIQIEVASILKSYPRLVEQRKSRTSADPWVIATARVQGLIVVTQEKPTGKIERPNIPDVCRDLNLASMDLLGLIKAESWVLG